MADTPEPNSTHCPTCNKYITNASYQLHTLHCARQHQQCMQCMKYIIKSQYNEHMKTHELATCPLCHIGLPYDKQIEHESQCPQRIVLCSYCSVAHTADTIHSHEQQCMNTTVQCEQCHNSIKRSDRTHSNDSCYMKCARCNESVLSNSLDEHELIECNQRMVNCVYCEGEIKLVDLVEHQTECGNRTDRCPSCNKYVKYCDMKQHIDTLCHYPQPSTNTQPQRSLDVFAPLRDSGERIQHVNALRATMDSLNESGQADVDDDTLMAIIESMRMDANERPLRESYKSQQSSHINSNVNNNRSTPTRTAASTSDCIDLTQSSPNNNINNNIIYQPTPARRPSHLRQESQTQPSSIPVPSYRAHGSIDSTAIHDSIYDTMHEEHSNVNTYPCKYCNVPCYDEESLQIHMLTDCYDQYINDPINQPTTTSNKYNELNNQTDNDKQNNSTSTQQTNSSTTKPTSASRASSLHSQLFDMNELRQFKSQIKPQNNTENRQRSDTDSSSLSINGTRIQPNNRIPK